MNDRIQVESDQLPRIATGLGDAGDQARAVLGQIQRIRSEVASQGGLAARALGSIDAASRQVDAVSRGLVGLGQDVTARGQLLVSLELPIVGLTIDLPGLGEPSPPIDGPMDLPGIGDHLPPIDGPMDLPGVGDRLPPIDGPIELPGITIPGLPGLGQGPETYPQPPGLGGILFDTPNTDQGNGDQNPPQDGQPQGPYAPPRELPRDPVTGNPIPEPDAEGPHTQLGTRRSRGGRGPDSYPQGREFDENGKPVRDIDWTDHGRPYLPGHVNPHQHVYDPQTGKRGPAEPLPPIEA